MVNVTKENFIEQSNNLLQHLPDASFIAIDEEMTGISIPGSGRPPKDQSPAQRWSVLRQAPERYSIIQLGISLFCKSDNNDDWKVRRYNFYQFPGASANFNGADTREVVLNPSAVAFLNQHQMSFDLWSKQGIPFSTTEQSQALIEKYQKQQREIRQAAAEPATVSSLRRKVQVQRRDDIEFLARTMASLREWLDVPQPRNNDDTEGISLVLPACNSFLRRALYETIEHEYPMLVCESAGAGYNNQIRVLRLNEEEKAAREQRLRKEVWEDLIVNKIGLWRVFDAISRVCNGRELPRQSVIFAESVEHVDFDYEEDDWMATGRKIPLVVHNGFMDILFLLTHFHSHKLPDSIADTKALIRDYFPIIYDTKLVSTECNTPWNNDFTNLSNLYKRIVLENTALNDRIVVIDDTTTQDAVASPDQEHEAAFDAYMTGAVFIGLCEYIYAQDANGSVHDWVGLLSENDGAEARVRFGRNKLYQMSMYTLDLEELKDPLSRGMLPRFTYRVANTDPSVTTRDIIRSVSGLMDDSGRRVNFDIVWVDDTTFMVAACFKPDERAQAQEAEEGEIDEVVVGNDDIADILQDHGPRILDALRRRFATSTICTLDEHLDSLDMATREQENWFSRIWNLFSGNKRKADTSQAPDCGSKRRRIVPPSA